MTGSGQPSEQSNHQVVWFQLANRVLCQLFHRDDDISARKLIS